MGVAGLFSGSRVGEISVEGLTDRENKLLTKLSKSTVLIAMSYNQMITATGLGEEMAPMEANRAALSAAMGDSNAALDMAKETLNPVNNKETRDIIAKRMQEELKKAMDANDEEKLQQLDTVVKTAKAERMASDILVGAAILDATTILKDASTGLTTLSDAGDQLTHIIKTVKGVEEILTLRSNASKMLKAATMEYEKTRKIKKPTKSERQAAEASVEKE